MAPAWFASYAVVIFLMWAIMMMAMMLPTFGPTGLFVVDIAVANVRTASDANCGWTAMLYVGLVLAGSLPGRAWGQSRLPPCPTDQVAYWNNCFGTYTFPDGSKYVGEFRDNKPNGEGTYTFPDGQKHAGEFRDGQPDGHGTDTYPGGGKYVGGFRDGEHNGQGIRTFPGGTTYVGDFRNGKYQGQGTYTLPDGRKYVGEWREDKPNGLGTIYSANGRVIKTGLWSSGKFMGPVATRPSTTPTSHHAGVTLIKGGGLVKVPVVINGSLVLLVTSVTGAKT